MEKVLVLLSGGADSATLAAKLQSEGYDVHALTMFYQDVEYHSVEVEFARALARRLGITHTCVDMSPLIVLFYGASADFAFRHGNMDTRCSDHNHIVAPGSVELLHVLASSYALMHGIRRVFWTIHADDINYQDSIYDEASLLRYRAHLEALIHEMSHGEVTLELPFLHMRKADIMRMGMALGIDYEGETYSCSNGNDQHCGTCPQCILRNQALVEISAVEIAK